jgi:hypothetical protein
MLYQFYLFKDRTTDRPESFFLTIVPVYLLLTINFQLNNFYYLLFAFYVCRVSEIGAGHWVGA